LFVYSNLEIFIRDRLPVYRSKILNVGVDHQSIPRIDDWKYNQKRIPKILEWQ